MRNMILASVVGGVVWATFPAFSQSVSPPFVDPGTVQAQTSVATSAANQALTAAQAAQQTANAAVKTVAGAAPDAAGNAALPSTFNGVTCVGCTMASPAFTGSPLLNGYVVATLNDVAVNKAGWQAAIAAYVPPVVSVNGATGAVSVPVYTDAQAVAANAGAIANVTSAAKAASADVVQTVNPASGGTVIPAAGTTLLFINNSALLASLNVAFPTNPVDGQRFGVFANNTITTLGFTGATSKGAASTLAATGYARFVYSTSVGVWFRAG